MTLKTKVRLSGNSIAQTVSFVNQTTTNHNSTYSRKKCFYLVHNSCYGNRSIYE